MLVLLLVGLFARHTLSLELYSSERFEDYFEEFITQHNRVYTPEEKSVRFEIFKNNLIEINARSSISGRTNLGITKFSDYSKDELQGLLGLKDTGGYSACEIMSPESKLKLKSPDSFDWRDKNVVSPVKDQGHCGSCYAFSTTGNIESQYAIKHNQQVLVSEQQIVDCSGQDECRGGFVSVALTSLAQEGGSESEDSYPYIMANGTCSFDPSKVVVKVTGCNSFSISDENQFQDLVYNQGPISIYIHADNLHLYTGGIMTADECGSGDIDHAVLLVGYGSENGEAYWIIKNSWGTSWGEQGYFRTARGQNVCSIVNELEVAVALVE